MRNYSCQRYAWSMRGVVLSLNGPVALLTEASVKFNNVKTWISKLSYIWSKLKFRWTQLFEKDVFQGFNCRRWCCDIFTSVLRLFAFYALVKTKGTHFFSTRATYKKWRQNDLPTTKMQNNINKYVENFFYNARCCSLRVHMSPHCTAEHNQLSTIIFHN